MAGPSQTDVEECTLETARRQLGSYAVPVDRTDRIPLSVAVGRVLATDATANDRVPGAAIDVDDTVFEQGHQIRPADVGLLKAAGVSELLVRQRPQVGIVPTGDDLVEHDAGPDERVETAGFTLAQYADRWGGKVTYRNAVADDAPALRMAVQRDLTRDVVVVTGTEPGDTLRSVVRELGDIIADRVAVSPGRETGLAVVQNRPVLLLPESPVDARVSAVQLLRPLLKAFGDAPLGPHPSRTATLTEGLATDDSVRSFVPVELDDGEATPLSGTDLATATWADGWVTVPADADDHAAGESVAVENWDYLP
jgi:molybdopterin biosynthesis enzyme